MARLLTNAATFFAYSVVILCGVFLFIIVIGGVILLYALHTADFTGDWFEFINDAGCLGSEPYSQSILEERGRLTFPDSTQNIIAKSVAGHECVVFINFEMASEDLQAFLESAYVSSLELTPGNGLTEFTGLIAGSVDWGFLRSQTYLYGKGDKGSREKQYVVVDPGNNELYIVYVITLLE